MNCPNCNTQNADGAKFCNNCGYNFVNPQEQSGQPIQQNQQQSVPTYQPSTQQPAKKKPKWWLIAIAVILVLLLFKACFGGSSDNDANVSNSSVGTSSTSKNKNEMQDKGTLGNYEVEIVSAEKIKDYEGNPAIVVEYKFTNNGEEATNFMSAVVYQAYQDGIQLDSAVVIDSSYDSDAILKNIKSGKSLTVYYAYLLNDETTPVEIEVSEFISLSNKKVVKTFELSK